MIYFSDLERIWSIDPRGRLRLVRPKRGVHTHALAISPTGHLLGEESDYRPSDQSYWESIWQVGRRGFRHIYGPTPRPAKGMGLLRDARGCSYHSDQTGLGGRPLVHRRCPGRGAERLFGTAADDRRFRPILVNDVAGTALASDGSFYFRQGRAVRRIARDGRLTLVAGSISPENFGIAVDGEGRLFVAELAARRVVGIDRSGRRTIAARSEKPWGPTGVACAGGALYLLEASDYRPGADTRMRVRRLVPGGAARTLATVTLGR